MIQTPFETIGQTTFGSTAQVRAALDKFLRAHLQCRSCSPADSQDDQVGEDDEDNEYGDEYEGQFPEEIEGSTYKDSATLPLALQRLKLERPAFERFPLPSKCHETLVLLIYLVTLLAIASSPTIMAAHSPTAGGWTLVGLGLGLQAASRGKNVHLQLECASAILSNCNVLNQG